MTQTFANTTLSRKRPALCALIWAVLALFISARAYSAQPEDFVLSRAVLADPAGTLSLVEVQKRDFQPSGAVLSKGYTPSVHWLRLEIQAPPSGGELELRIRPTWLDEVRIYEPDASAPGGWKERIVGDRVAYAQRDRGAVSFRISIQPRAPRSTYYLRLNTTSSSMLRVEALLPPVADRQDLRINLFQILYIGVMSWILFWAARDYWIQPSSLTAWFVVYQATFIAYDIAYIGYLGPFLPASIGNAVTSFFVLAIVSAGIRFHTALFALYEPPRWLLWLMNAFLLLFPAQLIGLATGHAQIALAVNSYTVLVFTLFIVVVLVTVRRESVPSRRALRITYGIMTTMLFTSMLPMLGIVRAVEWHLQSTLVHGLVTASLMFLMLHLRSRTLLDEGRRAQIDLEIARRQLVLEKDKQDEQTRFMAMLTHELKTPISVVRLALGLRSPSPSAWRHAQTALDDIDAIVERCQLSDQLEQEQLDQTPFFQGQIHKAQTGAQRLIFRPAACNVDDVLRELRIGSATPERVCIESDATFKSRPEVRTDAQLLRVILSNLLDNGLKYSAPGTHLHIEAASDADTHVRITFMNQPGPAGLPDPERVFSRYYRSPGAHSRSGSGQGLYIVQGLARLLGAHVAYDVFEGQARFTLCMPR